MLIGKIETHNPKIARFALLPRYKKHLESALLRRTSDPRSEVLRFFVRISCGLNEAMEGATLTKDLTPQDLAVLRHIVLNLLKREKTA